jgi:hypothetical protein
MKNYLKLNIEFMPTAYHSPGSEVRRHSTVSWVAGHTENTYFYGRPHATKSDRFVVYGVVYRHKHWKRWRPCLFRRGERLPVGAVVDTREAAQAVVEAALALES